MSYEAKTNWKLDDTVMPSDMNRIEQGIKDVEEGLANAGGATTLIASTDNIIDFNMIIEDGIYIIKNASDGVGTTVNGMYTNGGYTVDTYLEVRKIHTVEGELYGIVQTAKINSINTYYRQKTVSTDTWTDWDYKYSAGVIKAGTLAQGVKCNTPEEGADVVNKAYADTKATTTKYTATIPTTGWTTSAPYYVDISISGILSTDTPNITPTYSGTLSTDKTRKENWNKIDRIVTNAGSIRVYAFEEKPTSTVPIQLVVVR